MIPGEKQKGYEAKYRNKHRERYRALKRAAWYRRVKNGTTTPYVPYKRKNRPEAVAATNAVGNAIRSGKLTRPNHCSKCGLICKPHGHHEDYKKPLEVIWLCNICHGMTWRRSGPVTQQQPSAKERNNT
jgi:hypothetical protein